MSVCVCFEERGGCRGREGRRRGGAGGQKGGRREWGRWGGGGGGGGEEGEDGENLTLQLSPQSLDLFNAVYGDVSLLAVTEISGGREKRETV